MTSPTHPYRSLTLLCLSELRELFDGHRRPFIHHLQGLSSRQSFSEYISRCGDHVLQCWVTFFVVRIRQDNQSCPVRERFTYFHKPRPRAQARLRGWGTLRPALRSNRLCDPLATASLGPLERGRRMLLPLPLKLEAHTPRIATATIVVQWSKHRRSVMLLVLVKHGIIQPGHSTTLVSGNVPFLECLRIDDY